MGIRRIGTGTVMALDPESFAAKVLNPKKRKPDPETTGSGLPQNPTAKRKHDGSTETSRDSPSASASASQGPNANGSGTHSQAQQEGPLQVSSPRECPK